MSRQQTSIIYIYIYIYIYMYVYILCQKSNENHGIMLKRYLSYLRSCYCISPLRKKQVGANQQNYDEKELHDHSR